MFVDVRTHLDADSCYKVVQDAIFEALGDNDKKVNLILIRKEPCKRNIPNCIRVSLQKYSWEKLFE